jgi:preprotein translocase subunit SecG
MMELKLGDCFETGAGTHRTFGGGHCQDRSVLPMSQNTKKYVTKKTLCLGIAFLATCAALVYAFSPPEETPEISLVIGEPFEDMRKRSTAKIDPPVAGHVWFKIPKTNARLRFNDPDHGFITPPAKFFTVTHNDEGKIAGVRMSPQVTSLPLEETLAVMLDLTKQFRGAGWVPLYLDDGFDTYADDQKTRDGLKRCFLESNYWRTKKYQIIFHVRCFSDSQYPNQQRYLMTLSISDSRDLDDGVETW